MNWKIKHLLIVCSIVFGSTLLNAQPLIEIDELKSRLHEPGLSIIDLRPRSAYKKGHIAGAARAWRPNYADSTAEFRGKMASKAQMESLLSKLGVLPSDEIVLYDGNSGCNSARFWWILDYYGHRNVRILNGGIKYWVAEGNPLEKQRFAIVSTNYSFSQPESKSKFASLNDVKAALDDSNTYILDTRSLNEYLGREAGKLAARKGRIPGSLFLEWITTVDDGKTQRFKNNNKLKSLFVTLGLNATDNIIVYCQSGSRSAHTTFVLTQLLGFKNVRNYDGSWIEWSSLSELPIDTGKNGDKAVAMSAASNEAGYWQIAKEAYTSYASYLWSEITNPGWHNYFYWLILVSAFFFLMEVLFPWRKDQPTFRKDFWLDFFYMFFNFFLFSLIVFNAASAVVVNFFNDLLASVGITNLVAFEVQSWPIWAHLLLGFVVRDFVQWWIHRLLHRSEFLWQFHKVHHSVEQMGFAAHLRYHWMENVVYRTLEYIPLALIGIGLTDFFIIHIFTLTVGHWNHSNIKMNIGPLKYIFNNPQMHIWHHAYEFPKEHPYGMNFGLTLSVWDYLFGTNYIPHDGKDIRLGFPGVEEFPEDFVKQNVVGVLPKNDSK